MPVEEEVSAMECTALLANLIIRRRVFGPLLVHNWPHNQETMKKSKTTVMSKKITKKLTKTKTMTMIKTRPV